MDIRDISINWVPFRESANKACKKSKHSADKEKTKKEVHLFIVNQRVKGLRVCQRETGDFREEVFWFNLKRIMYWSNPIFYIHILQLLGDRKLS